jgi:hypothetical protein
VGAATGVHILKIGAAGIKGGYDAIGGEEGLRKGAENLAKATGVVVATAGVLAVKTGDALYQAGKIVAEEIHETMEKNRIESEKRKALEDKTDYVDAIFKIVSGSDEE